jgi:hypothetical protein
MDPAGSGGPLRSVATTGAWSSWAGVTHQDLTLRGVSKALGWPNPRWRHPRRWRPPDPPPPRVSPRGTFTEANGLPSGFTGNTSSCPSRRDGAGLRRRADGPSILELAPGLLGEAGRSTGAGTAVLPHRWVAMAVPYDPARPSTGPDLVLVFDEVAGLMGEAHARRGAVGVIVVDPQLGGPTRAVLSPSWCTTSGDPRPAATLPPASSCWRPGGAPSTRSPAGWCAICCGPRRAAGGRTRRDGHRPGEVAEHFDVPLAGPPGARAAAGLPPLPRLTPTGPANVRSARRPT